MRVGLDFDNTIVSYDALFHKVALEGGWIPGSVAQSKVSVRDHLRGIGKEEIWTEMQGTVYGGRMAEAAAFPGVREFLLWARGSGIEVSIVSHKTRHPFLGTQYDLHAAARGWIEQVLRDQGGPLVAAGNVFFELTKDEKLGRIGAIGCDAYVDDLPEILLAPGFPARTERLLFDPDGHHAGAGLRRLPDWAAVREAVEAQWRQTR
jgi:hypothetical protein